MKTRKKSLSKAVKQAAAGLLASAIVISSSTMYASAATSKVALSDIKGFWAEETIQWAVDEQIVNGYADGTFRPRKEVTQAEFLSMLIRAYSINDLPAVSEGTQWDESFWQYASQKNWELSSERHKPVTRGGVASIIGSSLGYACSADQYIQILFDHNLSNGKHSKTIEGYAKHDSLNRAEAVVFIQNMQEQIDELVAKPATVSSNCPVVAEDKPAPLTPMTSGSYTISSTTTTDSKVTLTAQFAKERAILVRVTKGDLVEKETFESKGKQLNVSLFFRHGAGQYEVEIFEKDIGVDGSYQSVLLGKSGFSVVNKDQQDREHLLPSSYVQSDHHRIIELAEQITKGIQTDSEKTRAIHDWVAKNIAYDVESYYSPTSKLYTSTEVLDRMKDVCSGYANLTAALNRAVGIKSKIIIGTAIWTDMGETWDNTDKVDNHAWVEVFVDGKWMIQDPTWNAGYIDGADNSFTFSYSDQYYNPTAAEFALSHRSTEVSSM